MFGSVLVNRYGGIVIQQLQLQREDFPPVEFESRRAGRVAVFSLKSWGRRRSPQLYDL